MADAAGTRHLPRLLDGRPDRACTLALAQPDVVRGVVLLGANPGIEDAAGAVGPPGHDDALADTIERDGVDAFLDAWLAQPLFASLPRTPPTSRTGAATRPPGWRRQPAPGRHGHAGRPVGPAREAGDAGARAGRRARHQVRRHRQRASPTRSGPTATFEVIPDAGHAAHLEQPDAFLGAVRRWLACAPGYLDSVLTASAVTHVVSHRPIAKRSTVDQLQPRRAASTAMSWRPLAPRHDVADGADRERDGDDTGERHQAVTRCRRSRRRTRRRSARRRARGCGASPRRTASVLLPASVSVGMSRRLLTTSRAVARQPDRPRRRPRRATVIRSICT